MRIFELSYLAEADLTDDDLHYLFDLNAISYSFIYHMLRLSGLEYGKNKTIKVIKQNNDWIKTNHLSRKQISEIKQKFVDCIKNIYQFSDSVSKRWVDDWYMYYGLSVN